MPAEVFLILRALLALALYAFLAWMILTLWFDFRARSTGLAARRIPSLVLSPTNGAMPEKLHVNRPAVTLGRNPTCDFVLDDETVSSRHVQIYYRHKQWWVEDLESTNGTFLNGQRVQTPIVLTSDDSLLVGKIGFTVWIE